MERKTSFSSRARHLRRVIVSGIKRFIVFLFSHVGLASAVVAYSILGGMIFQGLEAPYERRQRSKVVELREDYTRQIVALSKNLENTTESLEQWRRKTHRIVQEFQDKVHDLTSTYGWDGCDPDEDLQWTFPAALLFSATVITTIGYGHIAPKTGWGRVVTILYALVGIPLTFMCLRNIGSLLSMCVKLVYQHAGIGLMRRWVLLKRSMRRSRRIARIREAAERARKWSRQMSRGSVDNNVNVKPTKQDGPERPALPEDIPIRSAASREILLLEEEKLDIGLKPIPTETSKVRVPVSLTLFLMTGYIIGGAVMFALWEKDWDFLVASYFCFITLSTIGFGDYVPGTSSDSWASQEKRVMCCLYLLFGMAMQAMCFHLMQEEVVHKFRNLAKKVGLLDEEKKAEDE